MRGSWHKQFTLYVWGGGDFGQEVNFPFLNCICHEWEADICNSSQHWQTKSLHQVNSQTSHSASFPISCACIERGIGRHWRSCALDSGEDNIESIGTRCCLITFWATMFIKFCRERRLTENYDDEQASENVGHRYVSNSIYKRRTNERTLCRAVRLCLRWSSAPC